jgi:hypothetical protein
MIDGIEILYQQIADSIVEAVREPWTIAIIEAIFYSDSITWETEYNREGGGLASFAMPSRANSAFREIRRKFKEAGLPVWGQARFELNAGGKFKMTWGYDNCDKNGDTIFDEAEWSRRHDERTKRLSGKINGTS